ncbi:flagellar hook assembly protein FlgD [Novosphingopyxis sp. YJ-S2-01]|uniref:flagellar hook assembly protein FlgD n=1 Tax=Novosphingopyxis sp. YJ-S2-01 TaxID=2794021 RepID=UPI0018DCFB46|nr:flagellar hook capping FlgD N-terminal domain-containing protein [Novosphingopyxis sp. YJ-S2-01]MBH9538573.1 flagellar hook capping protein [Novosphingopyxis sp. YJ-S2-01]
MSTIDNTLPAGLTRAQPMNATGGGTLDQSSFLKLMTAQIKFQDPFKPVDNQQMVAQMAQFSSVAGIAEMNQSLKNISAAFSTSRLSEASQFIGKNVLAKGDVAAMDANGLYRGEVTLTGRADKLTIELVDGKGSVVRSMTGGPIEAGAVPFAFQSTDENGQPVDLGNLKVRVSGGVPSSTATWLPVSVVGISSVGNGAVLTTPAGPIDVDAVRGVG